MSQPTEVPDLLALQREISEIKSESKAIEQRVNALERVSDSKISRS